MKRQDIRDMEAEYQARYPAESDDVIGEMAMAEIVRCIQPGSSVALRVRQMREGRLNLESNSNEEVDAYARAMEIVEPNDDA